MMHYYGIGNGFGLWGVLSAVFWIIIIFLIVGGILRFGHHHNSPMGTHNSNALDILNERYAKGEITKEEYEQKKKDILK